MSASVIICGVRGANGVDIASLKQMAGRAGRSRKDQNAIVHIVAESDCIGQLSEFNRTPLVASVYDADESVSFHLLGKIADGTVKNVADAEKWFARSLAFKQGKSVDFKHILRSLADCGAIVGDDNGYAVAELGRISLRYYFNPQVVFKWKTDFNSIMASNDGDNPFAIAWALSTGLVSYDLESSGGFEILGQFPSEYKYTGNRACEEVMWYAILNHISLHGVGMVRQSLKENLGRINSVLESLRLPVVRPF